MGSNYAKLARKERSGLSKKFIALWLALLAMASAVLAQEAASSRPEEPWTIQRLTVPVTLDGLINEDAWQSVKPLPLIVFMPSCGNPPFAYN